MNMETTKETLLKLAESKYKLADMITSENFPNKLIVISDEFYYQKNIFGNHTIWAKILGEKDSACVIFDGANWAKIIKP